MNHTGSIQLFLDTCHLIHAKGLVSGSGGNISLRCDDGILITPSGRSLESLKEEDLVLLQMDGSYTCPTVASRRKSGGCIWPATAPARTSRPSSMSTAAMLWPFPV